MKGLGRADQADTSILIAPGEDLQTDGIEGHCDQGAGEQPGEQQRERAPYPQRRVQPACPVESSCTCSTLGQPLACARKLSSHSGRLP